MVSGALMPENGWADASQECGVAHTVWSSSTLWLTLGCLDLGLGRYRGRGRPCGRFILFSLGGSHSLEGQSSVLYWILLLKSLPLSTSSADLYEGP